MTKSWTSRRDVKAFSQELAARDGLDFQTYVTPFLRCAIPEITATRSLGGADRAGIDHLLWGANDRVRVAVQCKGFKVPEERLGRSQVEQCLASITTFRESGLTTQRYVLVHNRRSQRPDDIAVVESALAALVEEGLANTAELWDRRRLLNEACEGVLRLLQKGLQRVSKESMEMLLAGSNERAEITSVPFVRGLIRADPQKLVNVFREPPVTGDPLTSVLPQTGYQTCVLLGEFGVGKSTLAARATRAAGRDVLLVIAGRLRTARGGTKDILADLVGLAEFPEFEEIESTDVARRLGRVVLERLWMIESTKQLLVIDGLDESLFLSRPGGLQNLLNALRLVRIPVVLTTRSEWWEERQADFMVPTGLPRSAGVPTTHKYALVELQQWTSTQVLEYLIRSGALRGATTSTHGEWTPSPEKLEELFGDIPKRPLFLAMLAEHISEGGAARIERTALVLDWMRRKLARDIASPVSRGGTARASLEDARLSPAELARLVFLSLEICARLMLVEEDGTLQLSGSCAETAVRERLGQVVDGLRWTAVLEHSVLLPLPSVALGSPRSLRFSHRAFQELFTAVACIRGGGGIKNEQLPRGVKTWMDSIGSEGGLSALGL